MRIRLWSLCLALILAAGISAAAVADVTWSGPGWYAEAVDPLLDVRLLSGPYSDEATCTPNLPTDNNSNFLYSCTYESSDPTGGGP